MYASLCPAPLGPALVLTPLMDEATPPQLSKVLEQIVISRHLSEVLEGLSQELLGSSTAWQM